MASQERIVRLLSVPQHSCYGSGVTSRFQEENNDNVAVADCPGRVVVSGVAVSAQQHEPQSKPDHMHHRFDDPERYAKSFDEPARDSWQMPARVIDALALSPNASVADIGAGTGYFSIRLAVQCLAPRSTQSMSNLRCSRTFANVRSAKVSKCGHRAGEQYEP